MCGFCGHPELGRLRLGEEMITVNYNDHNSSRDTVVNLLPVNVVLKGIFRGTKGLWIYSCTHEVPRLILIKALDIRQGTEPDITSSLFPFTVYENIIRTEQFELMDTYPRSRFEILK